MWMEAARARTAEILHQRKRMKKRLALAAERFNSDQKGEAQPFANTMSSITVDLGHCQGVA